MAIYLNRVSKIRGKEAFTKAAYGDKWQTLSSTVREQANWFCSKCGQDMSQSKHLLHSHHIIPLSKGGSNSVSNLQALCKKCHNEEHNH